MKRIVICFEIGASPRTKLYRRIIRWKPTCVDFSSPCRIAPRTVLGRSSGTTKGRHKWYDHYIGGALGAGLEINIVQGYEFLAKEYEQGDEVYILGFSRGAYTARSLVGIDSRVGLNFRSISRCASSWLHGIYRTRDDKTDSMTAKMFRAAFSREIKIKFVGVWDTVGALGLPLHVTKDVNMKFYEFHDTKLSSIVDNAFHAVAIDEHRKTRRCLWSPDSAPQQQLEQRWFLGAHCDVGGGYPDRRLADIILGWMQGKASALGLALTPVTLGAQNYRGEFTDYYAKFLGGLYAKKTHGTIRYRRGEIWQGSGRPIGATPAQRRPRLRTAE